MEPISSKCSPQLKCEHSASFRKPNPTILLREQIISSLETLQKALPRLSEKEREQAAEIVRQSERILNNEGIRWFVPHGGQEDFIDNYLFRDGGFIVIGGQGNGSGKTTMIVAIVAALMWPDIASSCLTKHGVVKNWPHPKRARIYSTPAELEEIGALQTAIVKLFPSGRYTASKGRYSYPSVFKSDTGWVLDLFSYERDASEAAGPNIGFQAFNEPPPEDLFREATARARSGGLVLGGFTSLLVNPWVVDGLFNRADGKDIRVRFGDVEENCIEHGINGHLRHDQIEKILAQYDPDEREARKTGRPLSLSGRIFKGWDRNVHVLREHVAPTGPGTHYMVCDPAIGKPCAGVWGFVNATGQVYIYDEYPDIAFHGAKDDNKTVGEYAALFRAKEQGNRVGVRILDRHFGNVRRTLGGLSLKSEFYNHGIEFIDSYSIPDVSTEVETGILKVKEYLRYDATKATDAINQPKLLVSPSCRNTIAAMEKWSRNPKTGKPSEDYKDFADCVRYLVMANPRHEVGGREWKTDAIEYGNSARPDIGNNDDGNPYV